MKINILIILIFVSHLLIGQKKTIKPLNEKSIFLNQIKKINKDIFFKNNLKCTIFEESITSITEEIMYHLDSISAEEFNNQKIKLKDIAKLLVDQSNKEHELHRDFNKLEIDNNYLEDALETSRQAKTYIDKYKELETLDSLYIKKLENRNNEKIYIINYYIKMTCKKGNQSENILDNLIYYFDKDKKIITEHF